MVFLQLPIPVYWFVMHPLVEFWRRHQTAGFVVALLCSWPPVGAGILNEDLKRLGHRRQL